MKLSRSRHYSSGQWLAFKEGAVESAVKADMERHLAECDLCLSRYLARVTDRDVELAGVLLPPGFTARVVSVVRQNASYGRVEVPSEQREVPGWRKIHPSAPLDHAGKTGWGRKDMLLGYALAAAVTLMLLFGGWFDAVSGAAPAALRQTGEAVIRVTDKISPGWSERLVRAFSSWVDSVGRSQGRSWR